MVYDEKGIDFMKIIHCADIHIDSKMETHFDKDKANELRNDIVDAFSNMVLYAKENDVKVIIIAGDLFDTKETQQKSIKKCLLGIISQNPQIDFLYLRGNHDADVEFAVDENLPNLKRFSKDKWKCYSYENINIYGREFPKNIPISAYSELNVDANKFNIVLLHGQVVEYKTKDGAPSISLKELTNKNIDYLALGHIHEHKLSKLDNRAFWCYSGCLSGRGFDECGKKGFVVLDIDKNKAIYDFISVAKRKFHSVQVKLSDEVSFTEIMKKIDDAIQNIPNSDIVEVILTGEINENTDIEAVAYESTLKNNYFYIRVQDETQNKIEYEKYENDVSLKGEFIRIVQNQNDLSDDEKSKIIMTGIRALAGRE